MACGLLRPLAPLSSVSGEFLSHVAPARFGGQKNRIIGICISRLSLPAGDWCRLAARAVYPVCLGEYASAPQSAASVFKDSCCGCMLELWLLVITPKRREASGYKRHERSTDDHHPSSMTCGYCSFFAGVWTVGRGHSMTLHIVAVSHSSAELTV